MEPSGAKTALVLLTELVLLITPRVVGTGPAAALAATTALTPFP